MAMADGAQDPGIVSSASPSGLAAAQTTLADAAVPAAPPLGQAANEIAQELSGDAVMLRLATVIQSLTAQLQRMESATESEKKKPILPWYPTAEERYPLKDPARYTEFERKYPPDRFGEEAADGARVWKLYRDRANELDQDMIEGWSKTLDILLIFAGLFSAVATAFLIESYKQLQPDYTQYLALAFIAAQMNATVEPPSAFVSTALSKWTNGLWFVSLSLALLVALLAILSKQWLENYVSKMRSHVASNRRWAWRHMFYNAGLTKWGLDVLVGALPVMLHVALCLFFAGLVLFLWPINRAIALVLAVGSTSVFALYIFSGLLPIWCGDCPTATPLLRQAHSAFRRLVAALRMVLLRASWTRFVIPLPSQVHRLFAVAADKLVASPPAFDDKQLVEGDEATRDSKAIHWMVTNLPAAEEVAVAVECIGGLPLGDYQNPDDAGAWYDYHVFQAEPDVTGAWISGFIDLAGEGAHADPHRVSRFARAGLMLGHPMPSQVTSLEHFALSGTHDMQLAFVTLRRWSLGIIMRADEWQTVFALMTEPGCHASTVNLLAKCSVYADLDSYSVAFGCGVVGLSALPVTQQRVMAWGLTRILDRAETLVEDSMRQLASAEGLPPNSSWRQPQNPNLCIRALNLWCYLLNEPKLHHDTYWYDEIVIAVFCCTSRELATSSKWYSEPIPPQLLVYIASSSFAARDWPASTLRDLLQVFRVVVWSRWCGNRVRWSALHRAVLAALLRKCSSTAPASKTFAETLGAIMQYTTAVPRFVSDPGDIFRALRVPAAAAQAGVEINILQRFHEPDATADSVSVWRMAFDLCASRSPNHHWRFSIAAAEHLQTLWELRRIGVDVAEMVEELVGDDRGMDLILAYGPTAFVITKYAKELCPEWWTRARERCLALPTESSPSGTVLQHDPDCLPAPIADRFPSTAMFVAAVDDGGDPQESTRRWFD